MIQLTVFRITSLYHQRKVLRILLHEKKFYRQSNKMMIRSIKEVKSNIYSIFQIMKLIIKN